MKIKNNHFAQLKNKIKSKDVKIGIVGLGYVGLNLFYLFSKEKMKVFGFDKNLKRVNMIKNKKSYISDLRDKDLSQIEPKNIFHSKDYNNIYNMDFIIITVPTPLTKNKIPDLNAIEDVIKKINIFLRPGQCVILESTVYPGATFKTIGKFLDNRRLVIGLNFYLSYSPERISPGDAISRKFKIRNIPKIVSGKTKKCLELSSKLYSTIFKKIVRSENIEEAEMSKLLENVYRSVNISLMNEIKIICDKTGLNVNKIIDLANTKPYGFKEFRPGPGIGGHCIPIDPFFLSWYAKKNNVSSIFIEHSGTINKKIESWIFKKIKKIKISSKKKLFTIFFIGVAYKKNINDERESPAISLMKNCLKSNFQIKYNDPYIPEIEINGKKIKSTSIPNKINSIDLAILTTDHDSYDYKKIINSFKTIIDTRGKYYKLNNKKIIQA